MKNNNSENPGFVVNIITKFIMFFVTLIFRFDPKLNNAFKDFHDASDRLDKTWEEICKRRKGTYLDCDEMKKKQIEFEKEYYAKQGKDYRDYGTYKDKDTNV